MAIRGSCLCGSFRFEVDKAVEPFEICHCDRCRKRNGSAGLPMIGVQAEDFRQISGGDVVKTFEAPILTSPPAYHAYFCSKCDSPLPPPNPNGWFEIPAGLFDDYPGMRPDKHIVVEVTPPWDEITDGLPQ